MHVDCFAVAMDHEFGLSKNGLYLTYAWTVSLLWYFSKVLCSLLVPAIRSSCSAQHKVLLVLLSFGGWLRQWFYRFGPFLEGVWLAIAFILLPFFAFSEYLAQSTSVFFQNPWAAQLGLSSFKTTHRSVSLFPLNSWTCKFAGSTLVVWKDVKVCPYP